MNIGAYLLGIRKLQIQLGLSILGNIKQIRNLCRNLHGLIHRSIKLASLMPEQLFYIQFFQQERGQIGRAHV